MGQVTEENYFSRVEKLATQWNTNFKDVAQLPMLPRNSVSLLEQWSTQTFPISKEQYDGASQRIVDKINSVYGTSCQEVTFLSDNFDTEESLRFHPVLNKPSPHLRQEFMRNFYEPEKELGEAEPTFDFALFHVFSQGDFLYYDPNIMLDEIGIDFAWAITDSIERLMLPLAIGTQLYDPSTRT